VQTGAGRNTGRTFCLCTPCDRSISWITIDQAAEISHMNRTADPSNRRRWRRTAGILGVFLALNWIVVGATTFIPPRELTRTAMAVLEQRVRMAVDRKLEIPHNLNELPTIANKVSHTTDAWGRPILLEHTGAEVTLVSFGKDGRPGGFSEDTDIVHRFTLKE
jgi:hypothetical protein